MLPPYCGGARGCTAALAMLSKRKKRTGRRAEQKNCRISLGMAGEKTNYAEKAAETKYVVITADSGKICGEASLSGSLIRTAYKGESFELIREEGDWYVVKVDGRTGYIHMGVSAIQ